MIVAKGWGIPVRKLLIIALLVAASAPASAQSLLDYVGQCVPFARAASGIRIFGDAWTWWDQADGRYQRGSTPRIGSVVVFEKTARLPLGHVAVVSRTVEKRVLMLTHANWSRTDRGERGHAEQDVTLFDVSRSNDWSSVRVWFRGVEGLGGGVYPVHGFIYGTPLDGAKAARPADNLSARNPDYVGALIDAYVPR
jgi:surface antigen